MEEPAEPEEVKFTLKVVINRERTKVLFAEVDSDFADVLLSFLTLPLGTIVRLLQKHYGEQAPIFGSLSKLNNILAKLDYHHFWTKEGKLMLLNPRSSFEAECHRLKLNLDDTEALKLFTCPELACDCGSACMYYVTGRCSRGQTMNRDITELKTQTSKRDEVFTKKTVSLFIIADDLRMVPNFATSFIQTVSNLGITDATGTEERTVTVGFNEVMDLLKGSLFSSTPLTDLILEKTQTKFPTIKFEPVHHAEKEGNSKSEKMILKVIVQKSTQRFMFAQAQESFVDFLLSFLTIPLGGVEWLLGGNSCLRNIDNLYSSLKNMKEYLMFLGTGKSLVKPELAPMYLSKNQLFSLTEQTIPEPDCYNKPVNIPDPKGLEGSYVRGPGTYIITDGLAFAPLLLSSRLSIIARMQVKLSDIEELDLEIGLEEGLSILKASLTSTRALSNGLSSILKKQTKLEPKSEC